MTQTNVTEPSCSIPQGERNRLAARVIDQALLCQRQATWAELRQFTFLAASRVPRTENVRFGYISSSSRRYPIQNPLR